MEAYLDGEADPAFALVVRGHLDECWACSEDAEWLSLIKTALGRIGRRRPPDLAVARLARYAATLSGGR
ncbi:MAG: zf-HC2 domain-containing protein [Acidimicrobiales bacterium]